MNRQEKEFRDPRGEAEAENRKPSHEIERDVAVTRARIDTTLDAIESRFSPGELMNQAIRYLGSGPREYAANLGRSIKTNPLPATLTAVGILWLMASGDQVPAEESPAGIDAEEHASWREKYGEAREKAGDAAGRVKESLGRASHAVRSRRRAAGGGAEAARERLGELADAAGDRGAEMRGRIRGMIEENPLMVTALGLALGAALGAMLPGSDLEDRTMGGTRDELLERVKEKGREQIEKGEEVATEVADAVREKFGEEEEGGDSESAA